MDDDAGQFTGQWVASAKQAALVGEGYRHDNKEAQGTKTARFVPNFAEPGEYEVRLLYVATPTRATRVPVTIISAEGEKTGRKS